MCDIATRQLVENSVQDFVGQRKAFTAYDVTKDVRTKGVRERHNELKKEVHQIFNDGQMSDYTRALVQLPSAPGPAFLYHPPELDPNLYASGTATPTTVAPSPGASPVVAPAAPATTSAGQSIQTQGNGFVRIPVSLVKAIGLNGGDDAVVYEDGGEVCVCSPANTPAGANAKVQKVDPRGNVRLYSGTLSSAGIGGGTINVRQDGSRLVISE